MLSSKWAGQTITVKIVLQNIGDGPIALPNAYVFRVLDAYGSWWIPKEQYQNKSMYPTDTYNLTLTFSPNPKAGDLWLVVLWPTVDYFGQQKLFDIGTPPE